MTRNGKTLPTVGLTLALILGGCSDSGTDSGATTSTPASSPAPASGVNEVPAPGSAAPKADQDDSAALTSNEEQAAEEIAQLIAQAGTGQEAVAETSDNDDPGLALAKKSGCLACHSVENKIVGPAWRDVAARYAGDPQARARLIEKVSKGGKGNWTDVTGGAPMPPYAPRVGPDDIETLVDFVLSLTD